MDIDINKSMDELTNEQLDYFINLTLAKQNILIGHRKPEKNIYDMTLEELEKYNNEQYKLFLIKMAQEIENNKTKEPTLHLVK
jgi:hypothetical protein